MWYESGDGREYGGSGPGKGLAEDDADEEAEELASHLR